MFEWIHERASEMITFMTGLGTAQAYLIIVGVLFACGMGVPIPEDITLITAGILASESVKVISLHGAFIVGFFGVLIGDTILFLVGHKYGKHVFTWPVFSQVFNKSRIDAAEKRIQRNAKFICFVARFLPGLRAPIYLTVGTMRVPFKTFFFQDGLAALLSVPVWVYIGYWFGDNIDYVLALGKRLQFFIILAIILSIISFIIYKKITRKKL